VVLDWDPVLKQIAAQVVVRNRSQEPFAFKVAVSFQIIGLQTDRILLLILLF